MKSLRRSRFCCRPRPASSMARPGPWTAAHFAPSATDLTYHGHQRLNANAAMTKPVEIIGSFWTLAVGADPLGDQRCPHDFRTRVEVAAQAGFTGMGFWHADILEIMKKYSFKDMKNILDANGIVNVEVEW